MNDPSGTLQLLRRLREQQLLAAYPTAGAPEYREGVCVYTTAPKYFARAACDLVEAGARLLGGCCGTTPEHIAALAAAIAELRPRR
jgi:methionine synthase I (cobalamin-dependent)